MQRDSLSAFLHTTAWQEHLDGFKDASNNVWQKRDLPKKVGSYLGASRVFIESDSQLPKPGKAWFYRVQADSPESHKNLLKIAGSYKEVHSVQPRQTLFLDISKSEEDLLADMKSKHRYNIRVAEKHGIVVHCHSNNLDHPLDDFLDLLDNTADRHTFRTHTKSHYASIVKHLEPEGMVHILLAEHEKTPVAGMMLVTCGEVATYLHGGSDYENRNLMAPHLLHLQAIRFAKSLGCTKYDFWGTNAVKTEEGYEPITGHPSAGTTRFKLGFGGEIVEYPPTIDIIANLLCYSLYNTVTRLRSRKRAFS